MAPVAISRSLSAVLAMIAMTCLAVLTTNDLAETWTDLRGLFRDFDWRHIQDQASTAGMDKH